MKSIVELREKYEHSGTAGPIKRALRRVWAAYMAFYIVLTGRGTIVYNAKLTAPLEVHVDGGWVLIMRCSFELDGDSKVN